MTPLEQVHEEKMAALKSAWALAKLNLEYRPSLQLLKIKQLEEIELNPHPEVNHVRIRAGGSGGKCCGACAAQNGKIFRLIDEIKKPHLPTAGCECRGYHDHQKGMCLCYYEIVFDDEL